MRRNNAQRLRRANLNSGDEEDRPGIRVSTDRTRSAKARGARGDTQRLPEHVTEKFRCAGEDRQNDDRSTQMKADDRAEHHCDTSWRRLKRNVINLTDIDKLYQKPRPLLLTPEPLHGTQANRWS